MLLKVLIEAHAGWHICGVAADGHEAVDKAIKLKPDLVVLDFSMPGLNGFEISTQISKTCPTLPIVLCTIHIHPEMMVAAKRVGIREVVDKVNVATRLPQVIETLLKENPPAAASPPLTISPQPELTDAQTAKDNGRPPEAN